MAPPGFRSDCLLRPDRYFDSYGDDHGDQFADFDVAGSGWFMAECAAGEDLRECVGAERTGERPGGRGGGAGG